VIETNEKIDQVRHLIVVYWVSKDSAAMFPPKESHILAANEKKEYMGPILRTHLQGHIGCNLATSFVTTDRSFHEWIGRWGGLYCRSWTFEVVVIP
jgi:hypothetical protein